MDIFDEGFMYFFAFQQELAIGVEPITSSLQVMRTANCAMPAKVTPTGFEPCIIALTAPHR